MLNHPSLFQFETFLCFVFAELLHQIFETLYDADVLSEDAFESWERCTNPAEQEGKGVAIKSTTQFFTWLREAEEEDEANVS